MSRNTEQNTEEERRRNVSHKHKSLGLSLLFTCLRLFGFVVVNLCRHIQNETATPELDKASVMKLKH